MPSVKLKSLLLVIVQFACILYFLITPDFASFSVFSWLLLGIAVALGIAAISAMRISKFSVLPEPKPFAQLVRRGPYAYIRHPMYTAVLLLCLSALINVGSRIGLLVYFILVVDLIIKIRREENYLLIAFPGYDTYRNTTRKIIPFIW